MDEIRDTFRRHGLSRPHDDRVLGGVCSAFARRSGVEPWAVRVLFLVLVVVLPGMPVLAYPVLWILMPSDDVARGEAASPAPYEPAAHV